MTRELKGDDEVIHIPKKKAKVSEVPRYRAGSLSEKAAQAALAAASAHGSMKGMGDVDDSGKKASQDGGSDERGGGKEAGSDERTPLQHLEEQEDGTFDMCDILNENGEPVVWRSLGGTCLRVV